VLYFDAQWPMARFWRHAIGPSGNWTTRGCRRQLVVHDYVDIKHIIVSY